MGMWIGEVNLSECGDLVNALSYMTAKFHIIKYTVIIVTSGSGKTQEASAGRPPRTCKLYQAHRLKLAAL